MEEALRLAREGCGRTSPNPAVGCVVVKDGEIVGRGFHTWANLKHAEIVALEQAGDKARGADAYVTLEPCSHTGRTSPCADALIHAGVARVIAAMKDPNPQVSGQGFERLRQAGINVQLDETHHDEARKLNEAFIHFMTTSRPLVTLKAALTLDGKIAAPQNNDGWITSEIARAHVQQIRHGADAIVTGIGTVLEDDCLLTDRSGKERSRPLLRIILDSQLRLPLHSKMVQSAKGDLLVVTTSVAPQARRQALEDLGIDVLIADGNSGRTDPAAIIPYLAERRYLSLMAEAGSKVNWALLDGGLADKVLFYYAPKILGGTKSLPVAGGTGRMRRIDAILLNHLSLIPISTNEFAVEAYIEKN